MKEEPRTGLGLFKFFCVGFWEGGHNNFIGVGQDLGHKMPVCLVLAVPLVHSTLFQGMRGSDGEGGCLRIAWGDKGFENSLSHLGHSEGLPA